jgi:hypothetical protein
MVDKIRRRRRVVAVLSLLRGPAWETSRRPGTFVPAVIGQGRRASAAHRQRPFDPKPVPPPDPIATVALPTGRKMGRLGDYYDVEYRAIAIYDLPRQALAPGGENHVAPRARQAPDKRWRTETVHDYHDELTPVLAASLRKRAPGYTKLGFPNPRKLVR